MSELFSTTAEIDYPIIDADAHVYEPPQCWQERVPARLRAAAPKVVRDDGGDAASGGGGDLWIFNDGERTRHVGLMAAAGSSFLDFRPSGLTYDAIRPGLWDPEARLADMSADGIHTAVLYPSVCEEGARLFGDDRTLQLACVRAYNEWLLEFCAHAPERLVPIAVMPATGLEDAIAELDWALGKGIPSVLLSTFPSGAVEPQAEDDPFWARAQEAQAAVGLHIGSFHSDGPVKRRSFVPSAVLPRAATSKSGANTVPLVTRMIFSGALERFPDLRIVLVEANIGWIPAMLEQTDDMFLRYRWFTQTSASLPIMPSRVFHRTFWATFMVDTVGMELRHRLNLDHIMWSTDYPHTGTDWPNSRITIERVMRGLPKADVKRMLHTNAKVLYGLDRVA